LTWVIEHMAEPAEEPRFRRISALGQLAGLVEEIG
jgi:hypothetical protein